MEINGIKVQIGQQWITKDGELVKVSEYIDDGTDYPWKLIFPHNEQTAGSLNEQGKYWAEDQVQHLVKLYKIEGEEYNSQSKETIAAYAELQSVIDKHGDIFANDYDVRSILGTIKRLNLEERFGIPLSCTGASWYNACVAVGDAYVGYYGKDFEREISWSDDGRQPKDEWLYLVSFPTGPYIFGSYFDKVYPVKTFQAFFDELKAFGPKYSDTNNKTLYFTEDVAAKVHNAIKPLYLKYKEQVDTEMKEKRKKELEAELAKLNKE